MQATLKPIAVQDFWRSRAAIAGLFFVNGMMFALWASRIPQVQLRLALNDQALGIILLGISAGVLTALPLASGFIGRFSSRRVAMLTALLYPAMLLIVPFTQTAFALWIALFGFGMVMSTMDVAMNAQGSGLERQSGRQIMSSFHGMWSIGFLSGGFLGSRMIAWDFSLLQSILVGAVIAWIIVIPSLLALIAVDGEQDQANRSAPFSLPPRGIWMLGVVAFCSAVGEGAMADWTGVYMRDIVQAPPAQWSYGLIAYSALMSIGRFLGDWVASRLGAVNVVRAGGVLASAGLLLAIVLPTLVPVLIGFALVGIGVATVIPLAFSAAGNRPGVNPSQGIAGVATLAYSAFLAGPPLLGFVAEAITLRGAFGLVLVLMLAMIAFAGALAPQQKTAA
ncbi:MAG: MFS transporter [Phototrophicaceae bacterium]